MKAIDNFVFNLKFYDYVDTPTPDKWPNFHYFAQANSLLIPVQGFNNLSVHINHSHVGQS